jgi:pre-mRNA-splicing helicase BRR2
MSVLDIETAGLYRPRTKETREAYEALLSVIQAQFGDQPQDVLRGAADEVLASLKNDRLKDPERHKEVDALLGAVPGERFAQLVALGKLITDFAPDEAAAAAAADGEGALDEDMGVAVEFEDEDEEEEDEMDEVVEDEDEDEEGGGEEGGGGGGAVRAGGADAADAGGGGAGGGVAVQEIDAYWLQRKVSKAFPDLDAPQAQALAEEALAALALPEARDVENRLVALLDFDRFDLIKELVGSRARVVWCTRLARAQDDAARGEVEAEMAAAPETAAILEALRATRASARDRQSAKERSIREEARLLREREEGGAGGAAAAAGAAGRHAAAAGRRTLDLDSLTFAQGAHFNSNRTTTLPQGSYRTVHKGYEEVHVPALKPKPFAEGETLREVSSLPEWAQVGFKGMKTLNRIQSKVCETALFSAEVSRTLLASGTRALPSLRV